MNKIYNALPIVYANCFDNGFKEKYRWPSKDAKTGLFIDKFCKDTMLYLLL